jgi:heptaprenyl diphosphate synthase
VFHNIGQLFMAAAVVENLRLVYYMPVLLAAGFLTGLLIGVLAQEMIVRVKRWM